MKKLFTALCSLLMALLLTVPAMADTEDIFSGSSGSIQSTFARLQQELAELCKNSAASYMQQLDSVQQEQQLAADIIAKMQALQAADAEEIPEDILAFMRERGLDYEEPGYPEFWAYNIRSVTEYQDELSARVQTLMGYLQNTMSQYNSYQFSSYPQSSDTAAAVSASRGGSLFSTDGAAVSGGQYALTAFAALIGGAGGTALMYAILNRKKPSKPNTEGSEA